MSRRTPGPLTARQLLALLLLTGLATLALVLAAVRTSRHGEDPSAVGF